MKLDTLFSPLMIGSCEIPNRLVVPAMVTNYCNLEGTITERYLRYMEEKAKGAGACSSPRTTASRRAERATRASRASGTTARWRATAS